VGEVAGATALLVHDLISTGGTLVRTAKAARRAGARSVLALVSHGPLMPGAAEALGDLSIDRIIVTDSVPSFRLAGSPVRHKIDVLGVAPLLAEAIRRMHEGRALTDLFVF
jgi:ribose-phosphate pyrophosphokinase